MCAGVLVWNDKKKLDLAHCNIAQCGPRAYICTQMTLTTPLLLRSAVRGEMALALGSLSIVSFLSSGGDNDNW